jgi:hypothetical protein
MLMRLIHGEEPHLELYEELIAELGRLEQLETREDCYYFELYIAIRLLRALGYWEDNDADRLMLTHTDGLTPLLAQVAAQKGTLIPRINAALAATQL